MKFDLPTVRNFGLRYATAWCSRNPAAVAALFAPNGSLTINDGPPSVGRSAIVRAARGFMDAFPDMNVVMENVVVKAEVVEFHWTLEGHNNGRGGTGHHVRISGYEEWTFSSDGLVLKSLGHFDAADYQRQLTGWS
jgi:uncharacterized protein (TIGR02246 family)